jgi:hypothetical protein
MISYLCIAFAAFVFSQWAWNRCSAAGGTKLYEHSGVDVLFALAVVAAIYGFRNLP